MTTLNEKRFAEQAEEDARLRVYALAHLLVEELGTLPVWGQMDLHQRVDEYLTLQPKADRLWDQEQKIKKQLTRGSVSLRLLALVFFGFAEFVATVSIFRHWGVPNPERVVFGLILTTALVAVAYLGRLALLDLLAPPSKRQLPRPLRWLTVTAIAAVVAAVSLARGDATIEAFGWVQVVVFSVATLGGAVVIELLVRQMRTILPLLGELRYTRRRHRDLQENIDDAQDVKDAFELSVVRWHRDVAQATAIYQATHERALKAPLHVSWWETFTIGLSRIWPFSRGPRTEGDFEKDAPPENGGLNEEDEGRIYGAILLDEAALRR